MVTNGHNDDAFECYGESVGTEDLSKWSIRSQVTNLVTALLPGIVKEQLDSPVTIGCVAFNEGAKLPTRATEEAAGWDVYAYIKDEDGDPGCITIGIGRTCVVSTGLNLRIPNGFEIQVRSRSGLAAKNSVAVLNSPGTVDSDYSGDGEAFLLKIILVNHSEFSNFYVKDGDRIAQLVVARVQPATFEFTEAAVRDCGSRSGGFGSTGV